MTDQTMAPDDGAMSEATRELESWVFYGTPPTTEDVQRLLGSLPPVYGVPYVAFADWVQALPQKQTVERRRQDGRGTYTETIPTWTLYMSVAGRIAMLRTIAEANNWQVDVYPEPVTPTGVPGFLRAEGRIVYRCYVEITQQAIESMDVRWPLGRRSGTSWAPESGGKGAVASNPYEKAETSALGRAIAAWGIGVLPGSGIASLEEMRGLRENSEAMAYERNTAPGGARGPRRTREEMLSEALELQERVRLAQGITEDDMVWKTGDYLANIGVPGAMIQPAGDEPPRLNWDAVKDGKLDTLIRSYRASLLRAEGLEGA